jgi:P27 family predicted phage terminase small subunit
MSGTPKRDKAIRILQIREGAPPPAPADVDAAIWEQIFQDGRHLTARDERLVALLCRLIADARDLRAILQLEGRIVDGARGSRAAHPASRILKDTEASLVAVSSALVLTPAARARAAMAQEPQPEDRITAYRDRIALLARIGSEYSGETSARSGQSEEANGHEVGDPLRFKRTPSPRPSRSMLNESTNRQKKGIE